MRSGKAKVMQINHAGLVAIVQFTAPREPGPPPRARENQNGPKRVRLGGRVNEAALNQKHIINAENSNILEPP